MKFRTSPRILPGVRHYEINEYKGGQSTITIDVSQADVDAIKGRDLEVTLEPVQTREERLRKARIAGLEHAARTVGYRGTLTPTEALGAIERVDAEFGKGDG